MKKIELNIDEILVHTDDGVVPLSEFLKRGSKIKARVIKDKKLVLEFED